jgi:hypothetical protein
MRKAHNNRGAVLLDLNRPEEALTSCSTAIALSPDDFSAHWNQSLCYLKLGDFERGWAEYERRWKRRMMNFTPLTTSRRELEIGATTERPLIWPEQGVGDEVMFASLLPQAYVLANRVLLQIDRRLVPLFKRSMSEIEIFSNDTILPENRYDRHLPMGSLSRYFCDSEEKFKRIKSGYLQADKARFHRIRSALGPKEKPLCGISWRTKNKLNRHKRSFDLLEFSQIFKNVEINLVNLQYGQVDG